MFGGSTKLFLTRRISLVLIFGRLEEEQLGIRVGLIALTKEEMLERKLDFEEVDFVYCRWEEEEDILLRVK